MPSGEEIQAALRTLVARWHDYTGSEREGAQTFLSELARCYDTDLFAEGVKFEDSSVPGGFMDMYWRDRAIVEMKAPGETHRLSAHREQVFRYWRGSSDVTSSRPAPPYAVLCSFHLFEVWEPGRYPNEPRTTFTLEELPDRYEALLFLGGVTDEPLFGTQRELTREAAGVVAFLYQQLVEREAAAPETLRTFLMQLVWCLFAEDLAMLEGHPVQRIIETLVQHPDRSSYVELGALFDILNDPTDYGRHGALKGTRYVNGALFATPAKVHLEPGELGLLVKAAEFDWRMVDPTIFGSLMEGCLGHNRRWALGAHYTHEVDILKIVRPTIVAPWRTRIDATSTPAEARQALDELCSYRVLDPACGCGNFLYVAYRELRTLEYELKQRVTALAGRTGLPEPLGPLPFYPLRNLYGIDVERFSALIARVTLWMGHRQMVERFGPAEPVLPLVDLTGIQLGDALAVRWPEVEAIIGNPPFLGSQHLRGARGDEYIAWLKKAFGVGVKDYCVYWFRKAHDQLAPGQRAGLVGTNSVSQNRARSASLEYVVANGGVITDAVSTQKWPGEAKVHVSLVNWVKQPPEAPTSFVLDGEPVDGITAELRSPQHSTGTVASLVANRGRCFQGPIPVGDGFIITADEAQALLARTDANYRDVVRPYLTGEDITDDPEQQPRRWIIDFAHRPLEVAMKYPAAIVVVRERVKPIRATNSRPARRERWWLFGEQAVGMRRSTSGLRRYVASLAFGKRLLFSWQEPWTCPSGQDLRLCLRR